MVRFLNKDTEQQLLEELFEIFHENMRSITPFRHDYSAERENWLACVGPALKKAPRQILLLYAGTELAGFCMYYVNEGVFMVEELQIKREFRKSCLIVELQRFFKEILPPEVRFMEAYADRRNDYSQTLIRKLGMKPVEENGDGSFLRFRGELSRFLKKQ